MADDFGLYAIMLGCFVSGVLTGLIGAMVTVYFEDRAAISERKEKL